MEDQINPNGLAYNGRRGPVLLAVVIVLAAAIAFIPPILLIAIFLSLVCLISAVLAASERADKARMADWPYKLGTDQ